MTGVPARFRRSVAADLVVDAAGRGTRLPVWLAQWGFERPREDTVDVGIGYATHQFRIPDGSDRGKGRRRGRLARTAARGGHALLRGRHLGHDDVRGRQGRAAADFAACARLADEILPAHCRLRDAARRADRRGGVPQVPDQPVAPLRQARSLPAGIFPFGDAVVSFNPDLRPGHDDDVHPGRSTCGGYFRHPVSDLAARLQQAAAKTTYPVWTMNAIGDLACTTRHHGRCRWWYKPVGKLFDQFLGAAETDPVLAEWFLRRFSLLDSLYMVPSARLVGPHHPAQHAAVAGREEGGPGLGG